MSKALIDAVEVQVRARPLRPIGFAVRTRPSLPARPVTSSTAFAVYAASVWYLPVRARSAPPIHVFRAMERPG